MAVLSIETAEAERINRRHRDNPRVAHVLLFDAARVTARQVADVLWPVDPDRPETSKRTRVYGRNGAIRGTYPMTAARLLHRMTEYGWLVYDPDPETYQSRWALTVDGRGWALAGSKVAAR
jgi:hypothetical protein